MIKFSKFSMGFLSLSTFENLFHRHIFFLPLNSPSKGGHFALKHSVYPPLRGGRGRKITLNAFGPIIKHGCGMCIGLIVLFMQTSHAQNVKIYAVKDTTELWDKKYRSEIYWGFYKVDMVKKTVQHKGYAFRGGDKAPDLANLTNLFADEPKDWFEVLSPTKMKVKRVRGTRVKRAWNDFATPGRTGGSPSYSFFINVDTLRTQGGRLNFVLDKELTEKYKHETGN